MKRTLNAVLVSLFILTNAAAQTPCAPGRACVEAVKFESKLVGAPLPYNVVLPPDYAAERERATRYPVLYLLHGLGGSPSDWVSNRARLAEYAAAHRLIIVMPEGRDAWYTDSATVPDLKFETYFVEELIPDVDRRFRTVARREARAVVGLSMGGYGALKFGFKHPSLFALAGSMSGAFAAASWKPDDPLPPFVKPSVVRAFGPADSPTRPANDLFKLARDTTPERLAALPFIYLDCGTEDFLIGMNREFAALLTEKRIRHEYRQLPGEHDWPYWDGQIQEILRLVSRKLTPAARAAQR